MEGPIRSGERRDPNDRRWDSERRRESPAAGSPAPVPVTDEDRRSDGRRSDGNRRLEDRRLEALPPFDPAPAARILQGILRVGTPPACPICNTQLVLGPLSEREGKPAREVQCTTCRKGVLAEGLV